VGQLLVLFISYFIQYCEKIGYLETYSVLNINCYPPNNLGSRRERFSFEKLKSYNTLQNTSLLVRKISMI